MSKRTRVCFSMSFGKSFVRAESPSQSAARALEDPFPSLPFPSLDPWRANLEPGECVRMQTWGRSQTGSRGFFLQRGGLSGMPEMSIGGGQSARRPLTALQAIVPPGVGRESAVSHPYLHEFLDQLFCSTYCNVVVCLDLWNSTHHCVAVGDGFFQH